MSLSDFGKRAAISAAAAALAAGLTVGVAPTAQAAELWGGIATGPNNAWAFWKRAKQGRSHVLRQLEILCNIRQPSVQEGPVFSQCAALAGNGGAFSPAEGATVQEAEDEALGDLPGSSIVYSGCNDGAGYLTIGNNGSQNTR